MKNHHDHFQAAIKQTYSAAVFDIDGTLIEAGHSEFPQELVTQIAELNQDIPMAICSGRRVEGFEKKMTPFFEAAKDVGKAKEHWYFFLENGAIGMAYNKKKGEYEKFYQVDWPSDKISMDEVMARAEKIMPTIFSLVTFRKNECNVGIYIPERKDYPKEQLAQITSELSHAAREMLMDMEGSEAVRVVDSGVAVHVIPETGDKDRGVHEFAKLLRKRGVKLGPKAREILIIGDQPCEGCNDERLLNGKEGTPFTAEHIRPDHEFPIPIFDEKVNMLNGPTATIELLNKVKWK
jgi:hydroxymethylpyrimidine pyrophosphatase-like HAD family hydrolase